MTDREILALHHASCRGEITSHEFAETCADNEVSVDRLRRLLFWDTVRFCLKCGAIVAAVWAAGEVAVLLWGR